MDTEQLKLVLDMLAGTTGEAKTVAIAWIIASLIKPLIGCGTVFGVVWVIGRAVKSMVARVTNITELRDIAYPGHIGTEVTDREAGLLRLIMRDAVAARIPEKHPYRRG